MKILHTLNTEGRIHPPPFLLDNTHYLAIMGSRAYSVHRPDSDYDCYGFCVPPKTLIFPHLAGEIPGFGRQVKRFNQWSEKKLFVGEQEWGFDIYNIVQYFHLCMENNPNMVDSLFVPENCVRHCTALGKLVRDNRRLFLTKKSYHSYTGYAHAQMKKIRNKNPKGSRRELVEKYGYDTKYAYNLVRLLDEGEQILETQDLILGRNKEEMQAVRRGEFTLEKLEEIFERRLARLEETYAKSTLRHSPDEPALKNLLLQCLEMHYGSLSNAIVREDRTQQLIGELQQVIGRYQ
jgi:predicted nucleotidyltransferase